MSLWRRFKQDLQTVQQAIKGDEPTDRVWICEPLLVIDDEDGSIAFHGVTEVDVHLYADDTADLYAHHSRDGWNPSLEHARIKVETGGVIGLYGGVRPGIACEGKDKEGNSFRWYVNSLADAYFAENYG